MATNESLKILAAVADWQDRLNKIVSMTAMDYKDADWFLAGIVFRYIDENVTSEAVVDAVIKLSSRGYNVKNMSWEDMQYALQGDR